MGQSPSARTHNTELIMNENRSDFLMHSSQNVIS
jgi:hypothetical protein